METNTESHNLGTPAPPIDPDDVPALLSEEKPKLKNQQNSPYALRVVFALIVIGVVAAIVISMRGNNARQESSTSISISVSYDSRVVPPATLLPEAVMQTQALTADWHRTELPALAWQGWSYPAKAGDIITIIVKPISAGFTPILGLYDTTGNLIIEAQEDRTTKEKSITYTFEQTGTYTILVSTIGGTAGVYDIRVQSLR